MAPRLEYFFDYVSPFSYLADSQIPALIERTGAELVYRPMLLGGVMNASGNKPPFTVPAKGAYVAIDMQRWANRYGLKVEPNPHFPINTVLPMRVAIAVLEDGGFEAYHDAIFKAVWIQGANVADPEVLGAVLSGAGLDADRLIGRASDQPIKDALRRNTDEAVERGAFGAPTFFVGDEMFFGNDRLDFVEEALRS